MSLFDAFSYKGKRVVVVGAATGMGAAVTELVLDAGAEVVAMDRAEMAHEGVTRIQVDMSDRASIEGATKECGGTVDALFSCAGVADGTPGIERINFLGHRLMIELMLDSGQLRSGSSIGFISSAAGFGWEQNLENLRTYLAIADFDEAAKWARDNNHADYLWSKLAVNAYVANEAYNLLKQGIRINAILPGPTNTPLARANAETWLGFGADYREDLGVEASTPLDQAYPLVFLCSDAARAIAGVTLVTDIGYFGSGMAGSYPSAAEAVGFLRSVF
jgi:NAD(P)-dependent dehydrogenase (short-subunit alcohol dehydrogenase family)